MFTVGQRVWHRSGKHSGTVQECDGDTVYLLQPNGVEIEFPSRDLTATPPQEKPPEAVVADRLSRVLVAADITDEHRKVLAAIPQRTMQSVAALFERTPGATRFSSLDIARKINFIAEVTEVPYRTMKAFSDRPGELGLMMGRGLAARSGR